MGSEVFNSHSFWSQWSCTPRNYKHVVAFLYLQRVCVMGWVIRYNWEIGLVEDARLSPSVYLLLDIMTTKHDEMKRNETVSQRPILNKKSS